MNEFRWSDLHEGLSCQFEAAVTGSMVDAFRTLSGDTNPLHQDPGFARQAGFPEVVVFGLLSSAFYSTLIGVHLPGRFALLQGIDVDFVKPVFIGESLSVMGEIVRLTEAYRRIEIRARIARADGSIVSRAKIRVGLNEH